MLYQKFIQYCLKRKLKVKLSEFRYLEMRAEFEQKVSWWPEIMKCCDWLYDNEKKDINANRIRNWMRKSYEWSKNREKLKNDDRLEKNRWKEKKEPLWTPPL